MLASNDDAPSLHEVLRDESPWRSPLLGIAGAFTAGIVLDRFAPVGYGFSLLAAGCALLAFVVAQVGGKTRLAMVYLGLALVATRGMAALLFGVGPLDPVAFVSVTAILFGVAGLATMVPAWRAARVSPLTALRGE